MTCLCPTCNRPMEAARAPIEALSSAAFTHQQRQMVVELMRAYPKAVSRNRLFALLYDLDPNGGPENVSNAIAVRINKIRNAIERFGWTIPRQRGGVGIQGLYRLAPIETTSGRPA
jgi:DNA-binding response OmpR family regulator